MKMGVSSYSFMANIQPKNLTIYDIIEKAAKIGFEGIELANLTDEWVRELMPYDLEKVKTTAERAGIEICSWAMSADYSSDPEEMVKVVKGEVDQAAYLGAKIIRTDICPEDVPDPYAPKIISALREVADYCAEKGMTLVTENHGGFFSRPDRLENLVRLVDRCNFGLLCDFANYCDAEEDPLKAISRIKTMVRHVHMKDCHLLSGDRIFPGTGWYVTEGGNYWRCAITGQGNIPYYECIKTLALVGYDGYLIQEFEGIEDCEYAVTEGLDFAKRLVSAIDLGIWHEK